MTAVRKSSIYGLGAFALTGGLGPFFLSPAVPIVLKTAYAGFVGFMGSVVYLAVPASRPVGGAAHGVG